ncbi:MAG: sugar ABC transporter permease, partial [Firmicutes bacterium]|uniref:Sugar ABC transporter permease n=1 Tax=Geochorda subterranea TaxID=3109564 RepID=A0ABZ1BQU7_9FIRM|nr:sugar ABC transporter permease [Limnochorda sp. LNt]NLG69139.1 sugar ABC transporter permease [Bacillota bacterium]WRP15074.1 sugar ABC transporter permease [Limnochorda sp. LNt]
MRRGGGWAWGFTAPALLLIGFYLAYPTLATIYLSLFDRQSQRFVGLRNYLDLFSSSAMLTALRNNVLWLVLFTTLTVGLGLALAVLTDRVRYEAAAKALIFLPMAISFVGAGVIWKFVYAYRPAGAPQIGLANQVMVLSGREPVGWLIAQPWVNNLALIVVGVWIWTGFAMVVLSAAYKGIPKELLEAARVDGASEWQVFWRISLPVIQSTVAVVATTMVITVLKVFDIVYVMTNGSFGTEVMANRMYKEMFQFRHFGRASAIAVILFIAIVPVMLANIRRFRQQEATR